MERCWQEGVHFVWNNDWEGLWISECQDSGFSIRTLCCSHNQCHSLLLSVVLMLWLIKWPFSTCLHSCDKALRQLWLHQEQRRWRYSRVTSLECQCRKEVGWKAGLTKHWTLTQDLLLSQHIPLTTITICPLLKDGVMTENSCMSLSEGQPILLWNLSDM